MQLAIYIEVDDDASIAQVEQAIVEVFRKAADAVKEKGIPRIDHEHSLDVAPLSMAIWNAQLCRHT